MTAMCRRVDEHGLGLPGIGGPHHIAAPQITVDARRLVGRGAAHQIRQRFNHTLSQLDIALIQLATSHTKVDHRAQTSISEIADRVGPLAGIHFHWVLQWSEIACAVISVRRRPEIFGTRIMHMGQSRTKSSCRLRRGGRAAHTFDIQIILAPAVYLHHARAALRMSRSQPFESSTLAFEESFRCECPAFAIRGHNAPFVAYVLYPLSL